MLFVSRYGGHKVVLSAANVNVVQTDIGNVAMPIMGRRVQFYPTVDGRNLGQYFNADGTPFAHGLLSSQEAANQLGVSEEEAIRQLLEFRYYGDSYVALDDSGKALSRQEALDLLESRCEDIERETPKAERKTRRSTVS